MRKAYKDTARQQESQLTKVLCKAMSGNLVVEESYEIDSKTGYQVRVFTKDAPCTEQDVKHLLLGNRVVTLDEIYEQVGKNVFRYMVSKGYLVQHQQSPEQYWVSESAARQYDLPKVMGCKFYQHN